MFSYILFTDQTAKQYLDNIFYYSNLKKSAINVAINTMLQTLHNFDLRENDKNKADVVEIYKILHKYKNATDISDKELSNIFEKWNNVLYGHLSINVLCHKIDAFVFSD